MPKRAARLSPIAKMAGQPSALFGAFLLGSAGAEWMTAPAARVACVCLCAAAVLLGVGRLRTGGSYKQVNRGRALEGWAIALATTMIGLLGMAWLGLRLGGWTGFLQTAWLSESRADWLWVKLPTVIIQQAVLQWFVVPCLGQFRPRSVEAALLGSTVFALLHAPNPLLVGATWLAGFGWIRLYQRYRQLAPLVASHFCLAIGLAWFGGEYVLNMRVGSNCIELLPTTIGAESGRLRVMRHAIRGEIGAIWLVDGLVIFQGMARDPFRAAPATGFWLVSRDRGRMVALNRSATGVDQNDLFELAAAADVLRGDESWELYGGNANGWFAPIGRWEARTLPPAAPSDRQVQLYPIGMDGRCESMTSDQHSVQIGGWAIDQQSLRPPGLVGICTDAGEWVTLIEQPADRPDIALSLGSSDAGACGFDIAVDDMRLDRAQRIGVFAVDEFDIWHPLPATQGLTEQVAAEWPGIELPATRDRQEKK
jgi:hypothetical protein